MNKKIKFYNPFDDNEVCEGLLEEDKHFCGGYKIIYENSIISIKLIKIIDEEWVEEKNGN